MTGGETFGSARQEFSAYVNSLFALGKKRLVVLSLLVALGSALESIGITLLIPLLGILFGSAYSGGGLGFLTAAIHWLDGLSQQHQLYLILGIFVILLLVRGVVVWLRDMQLAELSLQLVDSWRARIALAIAGASWRRLQDLRLSRLEFALATEVARLSAGSDLLLRGIVAVLQLGFQFALAFYLSPLLCLIALVAALLGASLLTPMVRASQGHGRLLTDRGSMRHHAFSEFLAGMKLAKIYDAEVTYAKDYIDKSDDIRGRSLKYLGVQLRSNNAFQVASALLAALILLLGLTVIPTPPAVLTALLLLMARNAAPVQQLAGSIQAVITMLPAVGGMLDLEAKLKMPDRNLAGSSAALPEKEGGAEIAFREITYRIEGREEPILAGVSGTIPAGELAVLMGPSGGGKTTLADILMGIVEPDSGDIHFDTMPVADATARMSLRRQVAYVPQDPFLFDQSIRANLLWASPDANDDEIWQALAKAEADRFVRNLPEQLDAPVGNRGTRLSGGERQRICLARALMRHPRLLILDEATSALDRGAEGRLIDTLGKLRGSVTILMITHRLPPTLPVDCIFTLDNGLLTSDRADHG